MHGSGGRLWRLAAVPGVDSLRVMRVVRREQNGAVGYGRQGMTSRSLHEYLNNDVQQRYEVMTGQPPRSREP